MANERIPLNLLMNLTQPVPEFSPSGKTASKLASAPTQDQENSYQNERLGKGPRIRYSIEQLRSLNTPETVAELDSEPWPEELEGEMSDLDDSFISTPARGWGQVPFTPSTAPARMRHGGDDSVTPMYSAKRTPSTRIKTEETDDRRLGQREKQIQYGKATLGYRLSQLQASRDDEDAAARTPRASQKCSKRCWDAQVREWRVKLHSHDPESEEEWRSASELFPKETLELAAVLNLDPSQYRPHQIMPPADILQAAAARPAPRARVARQLDMADE